MAATAAGGGGGGGGVIGWFTADDSTGLLLQVGCMAAFAFSNGLCGTLAMSLAPQVVYARCRPPPLCRALAGYLPLALPLRPDRDARTARALRGKARLCVLCVGGTCSARRCRRRRRAHTA